MMSIFESNPPIFDNVKNRLVPNANWNNLLNSGREYTHRATQALGYYAASLVIKETGCAGLAEAEDLLIAAAQPPMTGKEEKDFRNSFSRMWALEDAFAEASHIQLTEGVEV